LIRDSKKVDKLGPARRSRRPRKLAIASESIDGARFAGITSAGKGDLAAKVRRRVA